MARARRLRFHRFLVARVLGDSFCSPLIFRRDEKETKPITANPAMADRRRCLFHVFSLQCASKSASERKEAEREFSGSESDSTAEANFKIATREGEREQNVRVALNARASTATPS